MRSAVIAIHRDGRLASIRVPATEHAPALVERYRWLADGRLASAGGADCEVRYTYDARYDLVAVTRPAIIDTPNGNDFPDGAVERYAYSSGFARLLSEVEPVLGRPMGPPGLGDGDLAEFLQLADLGGYRPR